MIEDAGKGLENFNKVFRVNPYKEAINIKNQKQLDHFLEKYTPALDYDDIALAVLNYARSDYLTQKILKDPDHFGAVMILLDGIDKIGGAKKAWDEYNNKRTGVLADFNGMTGYKIPNRTRQSFKTFSNELAIIRKHFNLNRNSKPFPKSLRNSKNK